MDSEIDVHRNKRIAWNSKWVWYEVKGKKK
jgi:hypothetical protein